MSRKSTEKQTPETRRELSEQQLDEVAGGIIVIENKPAVRVTRRRRRMRSFRR